MSVIKILQNSFRPVLITISVNLLGMKNSNRTRKKVIYIDSDSIKYTLKSELYSLYIGMLYIIGHSPCLFCKHRVYRDVTEAMNLCYLNRVCTHFCLLCYYTLQIIKHFDSSPLNSDNFRLYRYKQLILIEWNRAR